MCNLLPAKYHILWNSYGVPLTGTCSRCVGWRQHNGNGELERHHQFTIPVLSMGPQPIPHTQSL